MSEATEEPVVKAGKAGARLPGSRLLVRIMESATKPPLETFAVSFYDLETALRFSYQGDRWFHAASTFKAAILFALMKAAESGRVALQDPLQVRNRFTSIVDGSPFRIDGARDGDAAIHKLVGRSATLDRLAHAMITRSSNLATNLLFDFVGLPYIRETLAAAGVTGMEIRRGVEDNVAFQSGISNETTADGLLRLFRVFIDEQHLAEEYRRRALEILHAQEFNAMIPARLPQEARVAHKTGEISTHCHDAGIVFLPDRKPYVLAILTQSTPQAVKRQRAVAEMSGAIFRYLVGAREDTKP